MKEIIKKVWEARVIWLGIILIVYICYFSYEIFLIKKYDVSSFLPKTHIIEFIIRALILGVIGIWEISTIINN